jgi:hypothetical protein
MREIGILKNKNKQREEIQSQMDEYEAKGGKVTEIGMGICTHSKKISYNTSFESLNKLDKYFGSER